MKTAVGETARFRDSFVKAGGGLQGKSFFSHEGTKARIGEQGTYLSLIGVGFWMKAADALGLGFVWRFRRVE